MADMNLNTLLSQTMGGSQSASQELHQALHKAIVKHDQGLTPDQQSKAFIENLKKYSDSLDNKDTIIDRYLLDFGGDAITQNTPNNPKPPPANPNLTQDGPPPDSTGTANPFFSPSPMATFFQAFLSMIQMQGYIAQIQGETGIENMQATLAIGKDQANSITQQANAEANSLNQQANLDYVMGGLSLASAVGTLGAGLGELGSSTKEVGEAEDAVDETSEELNSVKQFNQNNAALSGVKRDTNEIDQETPKVQEKIDLKARQDRGEQLTPEEEDTLQLASVEKKAKESKEELETMQNKAQLKQQNLKKDIKAAEEEQADLGEKVQNKKNEVQKLKAKVDKGDLSEKEQEKAEQNLKKAEKDLNSLERKQKRIEGKIQVLKAKHESAVSDDLYAKYKLAEAKTQDAETQGLSQAEINAAKNEENLANTAFQNQHQKIIRNSQLVDSADINPGDKAEILGETDKAYKNYHKTLDDDESKLHILNKRKDIATQRERFLNADNSRVKGEFSESVAGQDNATELISQFDEKPQTLEEKLDRKLEKDQNRLEALKHERIGKRVEDNLGLKVFNQFVQASNQFLAARKAQVDAQGKLNAAFWQSRSTLDGTYLQMMQQAMVNMLEANKGSYETGSQYAQALMGISDKEVNTVHWAV